MVPLHKVTPRFIIVVPWGTELDPLSYEGIATIMWRLTEPITAALHEEIAAFGGDGIVADSLDEAGIQEVLRSWVEEHGLLIWRAPARQFIKQFD